MLEIKNCCKAFGDQTVLQDVSMTIPDGSIIGVSGASGIGKSTLAKILCGVMPPDAGEVFLDGKLLVSPKEAYDRKRGLAIQMVYQQPYAALDPSQKIGTGLRELISYHRLTKNRQETEKLIADILAQMQLPPKILAHLPRQISGGEAQRVALARALLLRPKLLILDEATSMLDVSTQANLLALVKAQMIPSCGSVLFISHDRALTDFYCDTVYAFDEDHQLKEVRV
ncbi:MAG: ABC transporter ATP-binding protein [Oscillospiraceae bacterium]